MVNILVLALLAAQSNPCRSPALPEAALAERLEIAEAAVTDHEGNLGLWFGVTYGAHAAVMLATIVIANVTDDTGVRDEMYVAAFGSGLGLLTLALGQPPVDGASETVLPIPDPAQRLAALEALLERNSEKITFTHSWISHLASFLYSAGASLVLWLALDRPRAAITQFLGGQLLGQGRILIQPTGSRDAWDGYRSKYLVGCGEPVEPVESAAVTVEPAGLGLALRF